MRIWEFIVRKEGEAWPHNCGQDPESRYILPHLFFTSTMSLRGLGSLDLTLSLGMRDTYPKSLLPPHSLLVATSLDPLSALWKKYCTSKFTYCVLRPYAGCPHPDTGGEKFTQPSWDEGVLPGYSSVYGLDSINYIIYFIIYYYYTIIIPKQWETPHLIERGHLKSSETGIGAYLLSWTYPPLIWIIFYISLKQWLPQLICHDSGQYRQGRSC